MNNNNNINTLNVNVYNFKVLLFHLIWEMVYLI